MIGQSLCDSAIERQTNNGHRQKKHSSEPCERHYRHRTFPSPICPLLLVLHYQQLLTLTQTLPTLTLPTAAVFANTAALTAGKCDAGAGGKECRDKSDASGRVKDNGEEEQDNQNPKLTRRFFYIQILERKDENNVQKDAINDE